MDGFIGLGRSPLRAGMTAVTPLLLKCYGARTFSVLFSLWGQSGIMKWLWGRKFIVISVGTLMYRIVNPWGLSKVQTLITMQNCQEKGDEKIGSILLH